MESRGRLPWERLGIFHDTPNSQKTGNNDASPPYTVERFRSRRLMEDVTDTFADSLRYVNRLYTREYGHVARKVPAHMPHFIQREIMEALHEKFPAEFNITSSHKVHSLVCLCLSVCLFVCLPVCLSVCLSVCPSSWTVFCNTHAMYICASTDVLVN